MSNKKRSTGTAAASEASKARAAKLAEMQRQARRKDRRGAAALWVVAGVLAIALIGGVIYAGVARSRQMDAALGDVATFPNMSANHVETDVTYEQTPPVGGDHHPVWQNCGIYDTPIKSIHGVHSLEHGAVWITYDPSLPADQVNKLKGYAGQTFMLLSPYPNLGSKVALSAWGHQLKLDTVDDTKITAFIRDYRQGPQTPEPGAACTGGTSEVA
ncbi:DUF3105 domain-containing protein [Propionibacteriaceae bacterium G1746]|uniref:DUF3105 domain-containing protein n=1 Tax=Aestuariimicrobium sp. G57 TaxID=3418485 RepID=UPI003C1B6E10